MDLLKHWELVDSRSKFMDKLFLVQAVLEQALKAVEFDNIVVSEQLLKLFVFVSESTSASKVAVLTIVKSAAFGLFRRLLWLLLDHWVVIRTIFTESASAVLQPVVANFPPHGFCLKILAAFLYQGCILADLSLPTSEVIHSSFKQSLRFKFKASQLYRQERLSLHQVRLIRSSLELV